jgi:hypothetical protein
MRCYKERPIMPDSVVFAGFILVALYFAFRGKGGG